jgi:hypothetical protein
MLRDKAPELYDLWLKIAQEKAATSNFVQRAPYEVPERLAQSGRPRALSAMIVVLAFCGYLASLGGPGPYIGGLIAILDLLVMLALFFGLRPDHLTDSGRPRKRRLMVAPCLAAPGAVLRTGLLAGPVVTHELASETEIALLEENYPGRPVCRTGSAAFRARVAAAPVGRRPGPHQPFGPSNPPAHACAVSSRRTSGRIGVNGLTSAHCRPAPSSARRCAGGRGDPAHTARSPSHGLRRRLGSPPSFVSPFIDSAPSLAGYFFLLRPPLCESASSAPAVRVKKNKSARAAPFGTARAPAVCRPRAV